MQSSLSTLDFPKIALVKNLLRQNLMIAEEAEKKGG
jgi:hypothetical protein